MSSRYGAVHSFPSRFNWTENVPLSLGFQVKKGGTAAVKGLKIATSSADSGRE
jgi:hypothetical protein